MKKFNIDLVIPLYNKRNHILRALLSAQNQKNYKFNKIILVNDGSTDGVELDFQKFENLFNNIEIINIENSGVSSARNTGIDVSDATYVCFLDADDELSEFYLEEIIFLITTYEDKKYKIFSTKHKNIFNNEDLQKISIRKKNHYTNSNNSLFYYALNKTILCSSGICIDRKILKEYRFPKNISLGEDIYLWEKLLLKYPLVWSKNELVNVYKNSENRSQNTLFHVPYYLKRFDEIFETQISKIKKLIFFFFHYTSLFIVINQSKTKNKFEGNVFYKETKNKLKINDLFFRIISSGISYYFYFFLLELKRIFNNVNILASLSYLLILPSAPIIFFLIYLFSQKELSSLYLIYSSGILIFLSIITFQNKIYLSKQTINFHHIEVIINYRFYFIILILLFFYNLIKFEFLDFMDNYLFLFALSSALVAWSIDILVFYFEKKEKTNFQFIVLLSLLFYFILLYYNQIDNFKINFFISVIFIFFIYSLSFKTIKIPNIALLTQSFDFFKKNFVLYFFLSGIFFSIGNFAFRYILSINIELELLSIYFLLFALSTFPSSIINHALGQYFIKNIYFKYVSEIILILISSIIMIIALASSGLPLKVNTIIYFTCLIASIIMFETNIIRSNLIYRLDINSSLLFKDFSYNLLMIVFSFSAFILKDYIYFLILANSIMMLSIYKYHASKKNN